MKHLSSFFHHLSLSVAFLLAVPSGAAADAADSLRQVINRSQGGQKSAAYEQLYNAMYSEGKINKALGILDEWSAFERQRGDVKREANTRWNKIAVLYNYNMNEALLAEAPAQMEWFKEHEEWEYYYNTWDSKAGVFLYTGRVQTALHEAQMMLKDAQERNNDFGRVVSYQLSGLIYESMKQPAQAVENLQRALDLIKSYDTSSDMRFTIYDYLAQSLSANEEFQRELDVTTQWRHDIDSNRKRSGKGPIILKNSEMSCMFQHADALMGLGRLDEAQATLNEARPMVDSSHQPIQDYRYKLLTAQLMMYKKKPAEALAVLDSVKTLGLDVGGDIDIRRANAMMELGQHSEAAKIYRDKYNELDSVFNRDMRAQLDELNSLYKIDENAMRDKIAREKQRIIFIFIISVVILLALIGFLISRHMSAKRLSKTNQQLEDAIRQLKEANQKAEDSSKMKSDFIKSISHEIRTPLNILSGFTQVITTPGMELHAEQLSDIHKRINDSTDRIVKLVNKMLELSDSNNHEPIERSDKVTAADIVNETIHLTRIASTEEVVFEWDASEPDAGTEITTHKKYATRALSCLVENAQKFTATGIITIRLGHSDGKLLFIVEDTGIGIADVHAEHIFDEFMQIDKYTDGAGIGLTVARSIARRLGGDIKLDTTYTAGARFVMSLPTT